MFFIYSIQDCPIIFYVAMNFFFIRIQLYACNFLACECLLFLECYLHILKIDEFCVLYSLIFTISMQQDI